VSEKIPSKEYEMQAQRLKGFNEIGSRLKSTNTEFTASVLEFVLEGLHLRGKLGKESVSGRFEYGAAIRPE
jgi:hypothetical protein